MVGWSTPLSGFDGSRRHFASRHQMWRELLEEQEGICGRIGVGRNGGTGGRPYRRVVSNPGDSLKMCRLPKGK